MNEGCKKGFKSQNGVVASHSIFLPFLRRLGIAGGYIYWAGKAQSVPVGVHQLAPLKTLPPSNGALALHFHSSGGADQFQISLPSEILPKTMSVGELAAVYACLALHDDGIPITAEKISTLVKAANVPVEPYWPLLFAKLVEKRSIEDLITNVGSGGGGGAVAVAAPTSGGGGGAAAPPPVEEKKEEPKEESDDDMGFSLFD
ncbi:hypothetical protein AAG906_005010 [Vitis piasezkii]